MKRIKLFAIFLLVTEFLAPSCSVLPSVSSPPAPSPTASAENALRYTVHSLPQATVHTLLIPAQGRFSVTPALAAGVASPQTFAQQHRAIAVINAGFFDPQNQQSTSYITLQGRQVADPRQNDRLVNNPALAPYLKQIFNRSEFRRYRCDQTVRYDIAQHQDAVPGGCELVDAIGGGPRLLPNDTSVQEGFVDAAEGRDALGSQLPNARTAIGITRQGDILWVMVAQQPNAPTRSGLSLPALAKFMQTQGVDSALNLDGGSSSAIYYRGKTVHGKVDAEGNRVDRSVKSVLLVQESSGVSR